MREISATPCIFNTLQIAVSKGRLILFRYILDTLLQSIEPHVRMFARKSYNYPFASIRRRSIFSKIRYTVLTFYDIHIYISVYIYISLKL